MTVDEYFDAVKERLLTDHFPDLPGFPHHVHDGQSGQVLGGQPANIFVILDTIARHLTQ